MRKSHIEQWFQVSRHSMNCDRHSHVALQEHQEGEWRSVEHQLREYLERAHRDARTVFHDSLSLDCQSEAASTQGYPNCLPPDAKRGLFGEVFCGIVAETLEIAGKTGWIVPVFLFRQHREAEEHLSRLMFGDPVPGSIGGRTGSDFIAFDLDERGGVREILAGEAKCHKTLNISKTKEALTAMGKQGSIPVSLSQMKRVLIDVDKERFSELISSIQKILLTRSLSEKGW